ncbi:MAG: leucyl aminopeptidase [Bacillota bacterium]
MQVRLVKGDIAKISADALIVNLFEGVKTPGGATGAIDQATGGLISRLIEQGEIKGKFNEVTVLYPSGLNVKKLVVAGLGASDKFTVEKARQVAGSVIKTAAKGDVKTIATIVHGAGIGGLCVEGCAQALAEGSLMSTYVYDQLKSKKNEGKLNELLVVENDASKLETIQTGLKKGQIMAEATNLARDLVNAPGNYMTPTHMAEAAQKIAAETGLECTILEKADMQRLGMGSLLGVAQGSTQPPKVVVLRYNGNPGGETLGLVGKGLTFDSGGISLKPGEGMQAMKDDMAGGAAVIGAMKAIGHLKPKMNVLAVVPCTENMPSGGALKPGDVVRAMTGKTIEIISTDAEGRLILADGVAYAESQGASTIVDVATLTGACVVALGSIYSGIVANCDQLVEKIQAASKRTGERYWRLPSDEDYKEQYKSLVADIKNSGGRGGGTITGGLIIGEFVNKAAWAHLDIAGTCYTEAEKGYQPKGATGVAVRTLAELAMEMAAR